MDLTPEQKAVLEKENAIHEKKFQEFHKKVFDEMLKEAIKNYEMAVEILWSEGEFPTFDGEGDFEGKSNRLVKSIIEKKISMLGSHLRT